MSNINFRLDFPGHATGGQETRIGSLITNATLLQVTTPGFIDNYVKQNNISLFDSDFLNVKSFNSLNLCAVTFLAGGVIQLIAKTL